MRPLALGGDEDLTDQRLMNGWGRCVVGQPLVDLGQVCDKIGLTPPV